MPKLFNCPISIYYYSVPHNSLMQALYRYVPPCNGIRVYDSIPIYISVSFIKNGVISVILIYSPWLTILAPCPELVDRLYIKLSSLSMTRYK